MKAGILVFVLDLSSKVFSLTPLSMIYAVIFSKMPKMERRDSQRRDLLRIRTQSSGVCAETPEQKGLALAKSDPSCSQPSLAVSDD